MAGNHADRAVQRVRAKREVEKNGRPMAPPLPPEKDKGAPEQKVELGTLLSTVKAEQVSWLWTARIPRGKLTIIDGDPGTGKSVLTMDLVARVTRGQLMPGEEREAGMDGEPAGVVVMNAEDGLADTILPRLLAAGGDPDRVLALSTVPDKSGLGERPLSMPEDLGHLRDAINRVGAELVIVDPLMAFLGGEVNAHRDQDVRRALHLLAALAAETGAAVVVIRHLNKMAGGSAIYRGGGSIGIIGAARSGLLVAKDPDNPDRRILASVKCNLAKQPPSLVYTIEPHEGALRLGWCGESVHTADSLLAVPKDDEDRDAVHQAEEVLRATLADGPLPSADVRKEARKAGVCNRTLDRAKATLGVTARKHGFGAGAGWVWCLPCQTP